MNDERKTHEITLDGRRYLVDVHQKLFRPCEDPRLAVVSFLPNEEAGKILQTCLRTIQKFTPEPHELWVIDNHSPAEHRDWLLDWPGINLALNLTEPLPPQGRRIWSGLSARLTSGYPQQTWASYANAIGLELAVRLVDPKTLNFMTLHMDTMPCHSGWLSFLHSKIKDRVAAAGVRMDHIRSPEGVLHVLGYIVDYQRFQMLNLDFFPQLPALDVGDRVTVKLRKAGLDVFACSNTHGQPELVNRIPSSSPLHSFQVDRAFDDDGNVIFLHLGRGVRKSFGKHPSGVQMGDWVRFAEEVLLA